MEFSDYKTCWDARAGSMPEAMAAVDGSADEATLRRNGDYSAAQVRAALAPTAADRVFELGCGVARIGHRLVGECGHWLGLDISGNMLVAARQRMAGFGNVSFAALDGPRLPMLADASQDKGYCVAVFIHMDKEDFVLYLHEVARVLRPGGLFYFDHWNLAHPVGWRRFALELGQYRDRPATQRKDVARNQFCTPDEVLAYARAVGLEVLLLLADSPWVQLVLRKPDGDGAAAAREAERCRRAADAVAYDPVWTALFDAQLDDWHAGTEPQVLHARLQPMPADCPVAHMFRIYLRGLWLARTATWGPVPAGLLALETPKELQP